MPYAANTVVMAKYMRRRRGQDVGEVVSAAVRILSRRRGRLRYPCVSGSPHVSEADIEFEGPSFTRDASGYYMARHFDGLVVFVHESEIVGPEAAR